jgi:hypothetical protein
MIMRLFATTRAVGGQSLRSHSAARSPPSILCAATLAI